MTPELTPDERRAIASLQRLAKRWPRSLLLFGGSSGLTVRKPNPGEFYDVHTIVSTISGIPCDGGDGGDERTTVETSPVAGWVDLGSLNNGRCSFARHGNGAACKLPAGHEGDHASDYCEHGFLHAKRCPRCQGG